MRVTVDGVERDAPEGATIIEVADVPSLCFDPRQEGFGACRVCLVKADGRTVAACTTPCSDGMDVDTRDPDLVRVVKGVVELVLSEVPEVRGELAQVAQRLGVEGGDGPKHAVRHELEHPYLAFRHELCISCGRCWRACDEVQGTFALTATGRGFEANVVAGLDEGFSASACVACGACADTCPTEAITEHLLL